MVRRSGLEGGYSLRLETRLRVQGANHFSPYAIVMWYLNTQLHVRANYGTPE